MPEQDPSPPEPGWRAEEAGQGDLRVEPDEGRARVGGGPRRRPEGGGQGQKEAWEQRDCHARPARHAARRSPAWGVVHLPRPASHSQALSSAFQAVGSVRPLAAKACLTAALASGAAGLSETEGSYLFDDGRVAKRSTSVTCRGGVPGLWKTSTGS